LDRRVRPARASFFARGGVISLFLLYIDSSGDSALGGDRAVYVTLGVCVHEGTWYALESRVAGLKRRYVCPGQGSFELHAKDFCTTVTEQSQITDFEQLDRRTRRNLVLEQRRKKMQGLTGKTRKQRRKKYRDTDPFVHLTRGERSALLVDALDLIGTHDGIRLFAEVVDKQHLFERTGQRDAMQQSFNQIVSRFDAFLTRYKTIHQPASPEKGMLVIDKEPTHERQCADLLDRFREEGHPWGKVENVIESPFFVDSASASAIQLADIAGYALRRYIERRGLDNRHDQENFLRIYHRFDRQGSRLHGLRHYCREQSCDCVACVDRQHGHTESESSGPTLWESDR